MNKLVSNIKWLVALLLVTLLLLITTYTISSNTFIIDLKMYKDTIYMVLWGLFVTFLATLLISYRDYSYRKRKTIDDVFNKLKSAYLSLITIRHTLYKAQNAYINTDNLDDLKHILNNLSNIDYTTLLNTSKDKNIRNIFNKLSQCVAQYIAQIRIIEIKLNIAKVLGSKVKSQLNKQSNIANSGITQAMQDYINYLAGCISDIASIENEIDNIITDLSISVKHMNEDWGAKKSQINCTLANMRIPTL